MNIKRGALVEYTDKFYRHYPPQDTSVIKFGVSTGGIDSSGNTLVENDKGIIEPARFIHASEWAGWMPESLEKIWEKYHPESESDWDE